MMKMLLSDDHALFRFGLEGLLKRREMEIFSCSSGHDDVKTIKKISPISPDITLVDLRMSKIKQHLTEGQSNKVITKHVGISNGAVKLHVKSILKKLGLQS